MSTRGFAVPPAKCRGTQASLAAIRQFFGETQLSESDCDINLPWKIRLVANLPGCALSVCSGGSSSLEAGIQSFRNGIMSAVENAALELSPAIEMLAPHCDLAERLSAVPPAAKVRGIYFKSFETLLAKRDRLHIYQRYVPPSQWVSIRPYPLRDYLIRLALAGAALESPERVHDGMFEVWKSHATTFASSLLGRTMLRLLSHDPVRLTEQGLAARRQTFLYGHWSTQRHGPRKIEMVYEEEYVWIESAIAGGAAGTFEACGVEVTLETRLKDRFNGSTLISW